MLASAVKCKDVFLWAFSQGFKGDDFLFLFLYCACLD